MLKTILKRYVPFAVLSYILLVGLLYAFFCMPQKKIIEDYKREKVMLESKIVRLRESSPLLESLDESINRAEKMISAFQWLAESEIDHNLDFYNYIHRTAERYGVKVIRLASATPESRKKGEEPLYRWNMSIKGSFADMMECLHSLETGENFLIVDEIAIIPDGADPDVQNFEIKFSAIQKEP